MAIEKQPSCDDAFEPELLPVDIALQRIAAQITPLAKASDIEPLPLRDSLDRILAVPVKSPIDVPAYTNSAMDGYAISSADLPTNGEVTLAVVATAWAGRPVEMPQPLT